MRVSKFEKHIRDKLTREQKIIDNLREDLKETEASIATHSERWAIYEGLLAELPQRKIKI